MAVRPLVQASKLCESILEEKREAVEPTMDRLEARIPSRWWYEPLLLPFSRSSVYCLSL